MSLDQALAALNAALLETEEVKHFRAVRERAKADPVARAAMERYILQMRSLLGGGAPTPEQWQSVQRLQQNLVLYPALQEYMQAESRLGQLLHQVMVTAAAACGLETGA